MSLSSKPLFAHRAVMRWAPCLAMLAQLMRMVHYLRALLVSMAIREQRQEQRCLLLPWPCPSSSCARRAFRHLRHISPFAFTRMVHELPECAGTSHCWLGQWHLNPGMGKEWNQAPLALLL